MTREQKPWTLARVLNRCVVRHDCWLWQGAVDDKGYPLGKVGGRNRRLRGVVFELTHGRALRPGHSATPSCRNRNCLSPECLQEVSRGELIATSYASGARNRSAQRNRLRRLAIERGLAVVTMEKAREIRSRRFEPVEVVAKDYGITTAAIYKIWRNLTWVEQATNSSVFTWRPAA